MPNIIKIKQGNGHPNNALEEGELAFDKTNNKLYIGTEGTAIPVSALGEGTVLLQNNQYRLNQTHLSDTSYIYGNTIFFSDRVNNYYHSITMKDLINKLRGKTYVYYTSSPAFINNIANPTNDFLITSIDLSDTNKKVGFNFELKAIYQIRRATNIPDLSIKLDFEDPDNVSDAVSIIMDIPFITDYNNAHWQYLTIQRLYHYWNNESKLLLNLRVYNNNAFINSGNIDQAQGPLLDDIYSSIKLGRWSYGAINETLYSNNKHLKKVSLIDKSDVTDILVCPMILELW